MLYQQHTSSPIWPAVRTLLDRNPVFLYAPCASHLVDRDLISGAGAARIENARPTFGGLANPIRQVSTGGRMLHFSLGLSLNSGTQFIAIVLVSADTSSTSGPLFKIGGSSAGLGLAHGSGGSFDETAGTSLGLLRDGIAWSSSGANAWANGLNIASLSCSSTTLRGSNQTTGAVATGSAATWNNAAWLLSINGRQSLFGLLSSPWPVHLAAVFKMPVPEASVWTMINEIVAPFRRFERMPRHAVMKLFEPRASTMLMSLRAAAYTHPTLSSAGGTSITSNSFQPQVTYTF